MRVQRQTFVQSKCMFTWLDRDARTDRCQHKECGHVVRGRVQGEFMHDDSHDKLLGRSICSQVSGEEDGAQ